MKVILDVFIAAIAGVFSYRLKNLKLILFLFFTHVFFISTASATTVSRAFLGTYTGYNVYGYMEHSVVRSYFERDRSIGLIWQGSGEYSFEIQKRNNQNSWQSCGNGDERSSSSHFEITNNYGNPPDEYFWGGCSYEVGEAITEVRIRRGGGSWFVVEVPLIAPFLPREDIIVSSTASAVGNTTYIKMTRMFGNDGVNLQIKTSLTSWYSLPSEQVTYNKSLNRMEIKDLAPDHYYFRLRSTRNALFSNWYGQIYAKVEIEKPYPFELEDVIYGGYNGNWQPVFGVAEYEYDYNQLNYNIWHTNQYRSTTTTSVNAQNSVASGPYQMRVRAKAASGLTSDWVYSNEINIVEKPPTPTPPFLSVDPYITEDKGFTLTTDNFSDQVVDKWRYEVQIDNGEWHFVNLTGGGRAYLFSSAQVNGAPIGVDGKINSGLYRFRARTEARYLPEQFHSEWTYSDYYPRGNEISQIPPPSEVNTYIDVDEVYLHWPQVVGAERYQVKINNAWSEVFDGSTSETQINTSNLIDGNYIIKIRSIDEQGNYSRFLRQNFTIDAVPSIVSNITTHYSNAGSNNFISINWDSSEENVQYYLEYRYNNGYWQEYTNTANKSSPLFQPLSGTYQFRIKVRSNTTRKFSDWVLGPSITVTNSENTLLAPLSVYAEHVVESNSEHINVSWQIGTTSTNAGVSYEVQKYDMNNRLWFGVGSTLEEQFNVSNTEPGAHLYRVRASRGGLYTPYVSMTAPIRVLEQSGEISIPHSLTVRSNTGYQPHLSLTWQSASTTGQHFIEKRLNKGSWQEFTNTANYSTALFNPEVNVIYEFRVKTKETLDGVQYFSAWSETILYHLVTKPQAPELVVKKINNGLENIQLSWQLAEHVESYQLYQSFNGASFVLSPEIIPGDASSFVIARSANGEYRFRLDACNTAGCTPSLPVNINVNSKLIIHTELLGTVKN
ncbi:hypothetical protein [Colwellia sp. E150_009]